MASETETQPQTARPPWAWPPDDTEESILGTDLHQTTITNLRWGINEAARLRRAPDGPVPWKAVTQLTLLGCPRPDGSPYRTYPDVFVYPHPVDPNQGSFTLARDGAPILIVEALSESTYEADLDLVRGKGYSYAHAGVREYLTLDPTGLFLPEGIRAWRLVEERYQPWQREADGRWHSQQIDVAIGLEGVMATVYTRDGRRMHREGEVEEELDRRDAELASRDAELASRDAELASRDAELASRDAELERLRLLLGERQRTNND